MTTNYQILTDSSCDLPASLARTLGVSYAPLRVQFQGAEYENFLDGDPRSRLEMKAFYKTLRTGAPTSTTAVNPEGWSTCSASKREKAWRRWRISWRQLNSICAIGSPWMI